MKKLLYLSFLLVAVLSFGQERTISGNVISEEDGLPLPGATVMVKNTTRGISTDLDGNYSLKNVIPNDTLVFSFMGYKTQKIRADRDTINVVLQEDKPFEIPRCYPAPLPQKSYAPKTGEIWWYDDKNPKYNFRKNAKNNAFLIIMPHTVNYYPFSDREFQQKYNVKYTLPGTFMSAEYLKKHNKLTFKHLNKKYKKTWQKEIRKEAIGLDDFLKRNN